MTAPSSSWITRVYSVRADHHQRSARNNETAVVSLTFPDYHKPDSTFNYSVRVLESVHGIAAPSFSGQFDRYSDEGNRIADQ